MFYLQIFNDVAKHVQANGFTLEFERGPALTSQTIRNARSILSIPLPESLIEMYSEIGDGLLFRWRRGDPENSAQEHLPFGKVEFESLADLVTRHEEQKDYLVQYDDVYEFDAVDDPTFAKRTAQRMRHWLDFHDEGNGDTFSLDTAVASSPVVFNQHDWMDGGSGANGELMGRTLKEFMSAWSTVCFQYPASLFWHGVLTGEGVNWQSPEFREPKLPPP